MNWLDRRTLEQEKRILFSLKKEYVKAFDSIQKEITPQLVKMADSGKLNALELAKYNRDKNLLISIINEVGKLEKEIRKGISDYQIEQYKLNYYGNAYLMETNAQVKLAFGQIDVDAVAKSLTRPFTQIALDDLPRELRTQLRRNITQAFIQGQSITDLADRIKDTLKTSQKRAIRIARTETTAIANDARQDSMEHAEKMGLSMKKVWIATLDTRTRESHQQMDGIQIDVDDTFPNGLRYPGDLVGDEAETVNCRCALGTVIEGMTLDYRRAGGEVIPYATYEEWQKNRL
jgi:SPP1 gp7 family putative phage head morphogenesis protein